MTVVAKQLDSTGISAAQAQAAVISAAATSSITSRQFVFFAAFDGTNNDRAAVWKSGNPVSTNVGLLETLVSDANPAGGNVASNYCVGSCGNPNISRSISVPDPRQHQVLDVLRQHARRRIAFASNRRCLSRRIRRTWRLAAEWPPGTGRGSRAGARRAVSFST